MKKLPWWSAEIHSRRRCVCSLCYRVVNADFASINFRTRCHFFCLQSTTKVSCPLHNTQCSELHSENGRLILLAINSVLCAMTPRCNNCWRRQVQLHITYWSPSKKPEQINGQHECSRKYLFDNKTDQTTVTGAIQVHYCCSIKTSNEPQ